MSLKKWALITFVFCALVFTYFTLHNNAPSNRFTEYNLPPIIGDRLFDLGVVDVNADDHLDIYTTNHNFKQALLIANGEGGYEDQLSSLGLNQVKAFPDAELSYKPTDVDKSGMYIYWLGKGGNDKLGHNIIIRSHNIEDGGKWQGSLRIFATVEIVENRGFNVEKQVGSFTTSGTVINFSAVSNGMLVLKLNTWGLPIDFTLEGDINPNQIFVGNRHIQPKKLQFTLGLQDRHGFAWADYNDDGMLDVFITRGAIAGSTKNLPEEIQNKIKDQFFVSDDKSLYRNIISAAGFIKAHCSGRHVRWVDYNNDGLLDLYINCQDRGKVQGGFPKQLYKQLDNGKFVDIAAEVGLDIPNFQLIDFLWTDNDNDGDMDLLSSEDTGFYLYRNEAGRFMREYLGRGKFVRADKPGLKYVSSDYWDFDGKLAACDYDADGDLDVFSISKKGNTLLVNVDGKYIVTNPKSIGLPSASVGASWVDFDNDGLTDFHSVPHGLFQQRRDNTFDAQDLLVKPDRKYMSALVTWADLDNDGARDLIMGVNENHALWRWWEKPFKEIRDRFRWDIYAYRNIGSSNHWLQVKLVGKKGNRQAIGARVTISTSNGYQTQEVGNNDGALYSQGHYRLYFGLGSSKKVDTIKVRWPDGHLQEQKNISGDSLYVVRRDEASDPKAVVLSSKTPKF